MTVGNEFMRLTNIQRCALIGGLCLSLATPTPSYAIWHWFNKGQTACNTCQPAPIVAAQPIQQTCSYVPQTCYRAAYCQVPVTTYRPTCCLSNLFAKCGCQSACNPCNPAPTTTMRPVTTYVTQKVMVPYTTYRMVYSNSTATCAPPVIGATTYAPVANYAVPAAGYAAPSYAAPATYAAPMPSAPTGGCSTCGTSGGLSPDYASVPYGAPSYLPPTSAAPASSFSNSGVPAIPSYTAPGYAAPGYTAPGGTVPSYSAPGSVPSYGNPPYGNSSAPGSIGAPTGTPALPPSANPPINVPSTAPSNTLRPIPDANTNLPNTPANPVSAPRLIDSENRTTSLPVQTAWASSQVSWPSTTLRQAVHTEMQPTMARPVPTSDEDAWRPSGR
jgi:hypothetical protein